MAKRSASGVAHKKRSTSKASGRSPSASVSKRSPSAATKSGSAKKPRGRASTPRRGASSATAKTSDDEDAPAQRKSGATPVSPGPHKKRSAPINREDQPAAEDRYLLGDYEEAQENQQMNPFIRHGYRLQYNTRMCIRSFLHHHNETGNVWTHFIGLVLFIVLSTLVFKYVLEANWSHYIVFTFFMFGCSMCMACSCCYHLFNCHTDEKVASKMFLFDLLGIATLITASFVPYIYFSFACLPQWRWTYLIMIGVLGSGGIAAPFVDLDERFAIYRTLLYVAITCSGLFPTGHILFGFPVGSSPIGAPLAGLALMFVLYGTGLIFYLAKIPERWYPGHFDYWLSSHQIWHMFVLAAALCHFFACVSLYRRYHYMDTHGGFHC